MVHQLAIYTRKRWDLVSLLLELWECECASIPAVTWHVGRKAKIEEAQEPCASSAATYSRHISEFSVNNECSSGSLPASPHWQRTYL